MERDKKKAERKGVQLRSFCRLAAEILSRWAGGDCPWPMHANGSDVQDE